MTSDDDVASAATGPADQDGATSDPSDPSDEMVSAIPARWSLLVVVGLLALAVGVSGGLVAGTRTSGGHEASHVPAETSADVGFARDMQTHHAQAVEMSTIVRERTDDPEVRAVALDIALTQQHQIGQMYAWLNTWGHPQSAPPGESMAWMTHDAEPHGSEQHGAEQHDSGQPDAGGSAVDPRDPADSTMPGMATTAQLRTLDRSSGRDAELLFLRLMIEHHEAGVEMARAAVDRAGEPEVRRLAHTMVRAQQTEIRAMRSMIQQRAEPRRTGTS